MRLSGVYVILNRVTGEMYVGASHNITKRWNRHRGSLHSGGHHCKPLMKAWREYGQGAFTFMMLECVEPARNREAEQRYLDTGKYTYNVTKCASGHSSLGMVHTDETRRKVGAASKLKWQKHRSKMIAAQRSVPISSAQRSEAARALWANPIYRERAVAARKGNAYSKGYRCTPAQTENRRRAARISNMKRNYGDGWRGEYARRYPQHAHEVAA